MQKGNAIYVCCFLSFVFVFITFTDVSSERVVGMTKSYFMDQLLSKYADENSTYMTHKQFSSLYSIFIDPVQKQSDPENDHSSHKHRKRRTNTEETSKTPCYSSEQLLEMRKTPEKINASVFKGLCAAIVIQEVDESCNQQSAPHHEEEKKRKIQSKQAWYLSFASITVINIASLGTILFVPGIGQKYYPQVYAFLISLGISVLLSDAFLHLLPHALGLHGFNIVRISPTFRIESHLFVSLSLIAGTFVLFLLEIGVIILTGNEVENSVDSDSMENDPDDENTIAINADGIGSDLTSKDQAKITAMKEKIKKHRKEVEVEVEKVSVADIQGTSVISATCEKESSTVAQADRFSCPSLCSLLKIDTSTLRSIVWMIQVSDSLHNFIDGGTIGIAFSDDVSFHGGISTSVTILFHEIPHELSDYAVLISSGLTVKQAIFMNFLSSLLAYVGVFIGVLLGIEWRGGVPWAFALAAGMFIYVSLAKMLPELKELPKLKEEPTVMVILIIIGLIVGVAIMFILSTVEGNPELFGLDLSTMHQH